MMSKSGLSSGEQCIKYIIFVFNFIFWVSLIQFTPKCLFLVGKVYMCDLM